MIEPIKPELRKHLDAVVAQARSDGRNSWDALNAAGLLYTEPRRRTERAAAVRKAMDRLDELSVPQIMGNANYLKGALSAGDMRKAIADRLYEISNAMQEGVL